MFTDISQVLQEIYVMVIYVPLYYLFSYLEYLIA